MILIPGAAVRATAQTELIAGAGFVTILDDETFLGRGPSVSVGIAQSLTSHVGIEAEFSAASHHRDAGYLAADGRPIIAAGRVVYTFRDPRAGFRPFASAGGALVQSTGTFTTQNIFRGPDGRPIAGAPDRRDWTLTQGGVEFGGGALIRAGGRFAVRPDVRWISTGPDNRAPSTIEPPLWILRPSVSIVWRLR